MGIESNTVTVTMIVVHNSLEGSLFCIFKYIIIVYYSFSIFVSNNNQHVYTYQRPFFSYINPYQADFVFNFKAPNGKLFNDTVMKNLVSLHSRQMGKWIVEILPSDVPQWNQLGFLPTRRLDKQVALRELSVLERVGEGNVRRQGAPRVARARVTLDMGWVKY